MRLLSWSGDRRRAPFDGLFTIVSRPRIVTRVTGWKSSTSRAPGEYPCLVHGQALMLAESSVEVVEGVKFGAPCRTRTCDLLVRSTNEPTLPPVAAPCPTEPELPQATEQPNDHADPPSAGACGPEPGVVAAKGQEKSNRSDG
jgi:hypothetical protein